MHVKLVITPFLFALLIKPCFAIERHNSEFRKLLQSNIFKTIKESGDKIGISAISKKANNEVVIYIHSNNSYKSINCQKVEDFHLIQRDILNQSKKHIVKLKVGLCPNKESIGPETVNKIETTIANEKFFEKLEESKRKEAGLYIQKENLNDGTKKIYYPSIVIGHGLGIIRSFIFFPSDNKYSLIFQYAPESMNDTNNPIFRILERNINGIAIGTLQSINGANFK